jgi:hypothetical protein
MTIHFYDGDHTDENEWQTIPRIPKSKLRRTEDVEYWRQRAGWFNDDAAMKDFNDGVISSNGGSSNGKSGGSSAGGNGRSGFGAKEKTIVKNALKVLSVVVALGLSILMFRAIMRRMSGDSSTKKEKKRSDSKTRNGSVKRTRSRSRSRKDGYEAMDDDNKSRRSSRSKSSRRSRSRSRPESSATSVKRSRSKSRSTKASESLETSHKETVLV